MRLTPTEVVAALAAGGLLEQGARPSAARPLNTRTGRAALGRLAARLVVGWVVRHGGAMARPVFDSAGDRVGSLTIWHPALQAHADWRLSVAAVDLVRGLAADPAATEPALPCPQTAADALLMQALADLARTASAPPAWSAALGAASPLAAVWRPGGGAVDPSAAWLTGGWLMPFLQDDLQRSWIAADAARRLAPAAEQMAANGRWRDVMEDLYQAWLHAGRVEHLSLFATLYERWLRARGGLRGLLRSLRATPLEPDTLSAREALEQSWGRLLEPALWLRDLAGELRQAGWERTAASDYLLGCHARSLEPLLGDLTALHADLCRIM